MTVADWPVGYIAVTVAADWLVGYIVVAVAAAEW